MYLQSVYLPVCRARVPSSMPAFILPITVTLSSAHLEDKRLKETATLISTRPLHYDTAETRYDIHS